MRCQSLARDDVISMKRPESVILHKSHLIIILKLDGGCEVTDTPSTQYTIVSMFYSHEGITMGVIMLAIGYCADYLPVLTSRKYGVATVW